MEYTRLSVAEQDQIRESTLAAREADHYRATLQLAELDAKLADSTLPPDVHQANRSHREQIAKNLVELTVSIGVLTANTPAPDGS